LNISAVQYLLALDVEVKNECKNVQVSAEIQMIYKRKICKSAFLISLFVDLFLFEKYMRQIKRQF